MTSVPISAVPPGKCLTPELLSAYVEGQLSAEGAAAAAAHVASCPTCRQRVESVESDTTLALEIHDAYLACDGPLDAGDDATGRAAHVAGYELRDEIHRGGQGVVFEALHLATKRVVALKVLLHGAFAAPRQRRRFEREIEMIAGLRHPNIVTVYDSGVMTDQRPYFAMEFVDGVPLNNYVEQRCRETIAARGERALHGDRPPLLREFLDLFLAVCDAIAYAHQHGVIHRDLKPSNLLIDAHGVPHVLDFGLAKTASLDGPDAHTPVTLVGEFMGTVAYASPEQVNGQADVDVRSDVYSLGVILYEVLTGHFPYRVTGPLGEIFNQITAVEPQRPSTWTRRRGGPLAAQATRAAARPPLRIDGELETIVLQCLTKEPERRYQSVSELARDIRNYLQGLPIEAKRDSRWYLLRKTLYRYRLTVLVIGAFLGVLAEATIISFTYWKQAELDRERAGQAEDFARQRLNDAVNARLEAEQARDHMKLNADTQTGILASIDPAMLGKRVVTELLGQLQQRVDRGTLTPDDLARVRTSLQSIAQSPQYQQLARELLAESVTRYADTVLEGLEDDPLKEARLRDLFSTIFADMGDLSQAVANAQRALELREAMATMPVEHPEHIDALRRLAALYQQTDNLEDAAILLNDAYALYTYRRGPDDQEARALARTMAALHQQLKHPAEAAHWAALGADPIPASEPAAP